MFFNYFVYNKDKSKIIYKDEGYCESFYNDDQYNLNNYTDNYEQNHHYQESEYNQY